MKYYSKGMYRLEIRAEPLKVLAVLTSNLKAKNGASEASDEDAILKKFWHRTTTQLDTLKFRSV